MDQLASLAPRSQPPVGTDHEGFRPVERVGCPQVDDRVSLRVEVRYDRQVDEEIRRHVAGPPCARRDVEPAGGGEELRPRPEDEPGTHRKSSAAPVSRTSAIDPRQLGGDPPLAISCELHRNHDLAKTEGGAHAEIPVHGFVAGAEASAIAGPSTKRANRVGYGAKGESGARIERQLARSAAFGC